MTVGDKPIDTFDSLVFAGRSCYLVDLFLGRVLTKELRHLVSRSEWFRKLAEAVFFDIEGLFNDELVAASRWCTQIEGSKP